MLGLKRDDYLMKIYGITNKTRLNKNFEVCIFLKTAKHMYYHRGNIIIDDDNSVSHQHWKHASCWEDIFIYERCTRHYKLVKRNLRDYHQSIFYQLTSRTIYLYITELFVVYVFVSDVACRWYRRICKSVGSSMKRLNEIWLTTWQMRLMKSTIKLILLFVAKWHNVSHDDTI